MMAQRRRGPEARRFGAIIHRDAGSFDQLPGEAQPLEDEPLARRQTRRGGEPALEGSQAHAGLGGQPVDPVIVPGARPYGVDQRPETRRLVGPGHGGRDELGLSTVAMRRHDEATRDRIGGLGPEVYSASPSTTRFAKAGEKPARARARRSLSR